MNKNFALIGVAGFVAPRHMEAIQATGNRLVAVLDKNDSVGVIDSYFPDAEFFTEFERFDRHVDKLRLKGNGSKVDYVSICTPNYLHDSHIKFALRRQADAVCEKPLVLSPWNLDALARVERETGRRVYSIMQLRHHPDILELKRKIDDGPSDRVYDIDLTYITARGRWYWISWKGNSEKSGTITTDIGIHFFDMLLWIFGPIKENIVHWREPSRAAGYLELERARVRWFLSVDADDYVLAGGSREGTPYRSITVDGEKLDFSNGFQSLHIRSYESILNGSGFGIDDTRPSIEAAFDIRSAEPVGLKGDVHPLLKDVNSAKG